MAGSSARSNNEVSGRPLLADAGSSDAFDLLNSWFHDCLTSHPRCRELLSTKQWMWNSDQPLLSTPPSLPTRVIDVGPPDGSGRARLFITGGVEGKYATLSHCWGKVQILTTTKANIEAHLKCIPFGKLPKTFQDAIIITRRLNLQYLWIDSLCIVQDDKQDWRNESVNMGLIYQNSEITIAASGASDGRGGCFLPRRPLAQPIELPHVRNGVKEPENSLFFALYPDSESDLELTPLSTRAWITQEWMLSRRIIHYTQPRMVWACKSRVESEDGEMIPDMDDQRLLRSCADYKKFKDDPSAGDSSTPIGFFSDWCDLVSTYCSRSLTYVEDKPLAIQGLVQEIWKGVYERYEEGIWSLVPNSRPRHQQQASHDGFAVANSRARCTCLSMQLLWHAKADITRPKALQPMPSWSWLSTLGPITYHAPARTAAPLTQKLTITSSFYDEEEETTIQCAPRLDITTPLTPLQNTVFTLATRYSGTEIPFYSQTSFSSYAMIRPSQMYLLTNADNAPLGWASFDEADVPIRDNHPFIYAAALSTNEFNGQHDGYNVLLLKKGTTKDIQNLDQESFFTRLGMGEIVMPDFFQESMMTSFHAH
jgi:hypothetical protein